MAVQAAAHGGKPCVFEAACAPTIRDVRVPSVIRWPMSGCCWPQILSQKSCRSSELPGESMIKLRDMEDASCGIESSLLLLHIPCNTNTMIHKLTMCHFNTAVLFASLSYYRAVLEPWHSGGENNFYGWCPSVITPALVCKLISSPVSNRNHIYLSLLEIHQFTG